ncbi:MAG: monovalent cation:proton antiporter-2 (CPA2) family protein [Chthoniobacterales bacterium]
MGNLFLQAFIYLAAAVISVPIAKRLGLGSVLGYLVAGAAIGPFALKLVGSDESVLQFAEFGVVMMLFLIGMELEPMKLWKMRHALFGLGLAQVLASTLAIGAIAFFLGLPWQMSLAVGMVLAMSSTAIVLQSLREKGLMKTPAGESCFSVLLFQDIAVIPILVIIPMLATLATAGDEGHSASTMLETLAPWQRGLLVVAAVGGIVVGGRFLIRPVFRYIAATRLREIFTAFALLLVVGIAELMQVVGLSPALGAFLAGVLLADSEYRPQLEADIEPFKGLLLGLFFISVGAQIDFGFIATHGGTIAALVAGLLLVKFIVLAALGRIYGLTPSQNVLFAFALAQGGEFAFVLLSFSSEEGVVPDGVETPLVAAVALSMAATPLLLLFNERVVQPWFAAGRKSERPVDDFSEYHSEVLIAGFGRFGHVVGRILRASTVHTTVLDHDADWVDTLRKFGMHSYYGDATRVDLLRKAGAEGARLMVVAIDDIEQSLQLVETVQREFPNLEIFARAVDRIHAYELMKRDVKHIYRETLGSSLDMSVEVMLSLGFQRSHAERTVKIFRKHDEESMRETLAIRDDKAAFFSTSRQHIENLEKALSSDVETAPAPEPVIPREAD